MVRFLLPLRNSGAIVFTAMMFVAFAFGARADIAPFLGSYTGSAEVVSANGESRDRDMSVDISEQDEGFRVSWTSSTYRKDGSVNEKSYTVDFVPTEREGVYAAAQKKNVFGHLVQLDPMKGEPYVWGQIDGDSLTVYSMFVTESGGYEMQEFDRKLAPGGLNLDFRRVRNGEILRTVSTFLEKQ
ncbi:MAG: hypothetical protein AAF665_13440 [Pseudomonadota bacterium]